MTSRRPPRRPVASRGDVSWEDGGRRLVGGGCGRPYYSSVVASVGGGLGGRLRGGSVWTRVPGREWGCCIVWGVGVVQPNVGLKRRGVNRNTYLIQVGRGGSGARCGGRRKTGRWSGDGFAREHQGVFSARNSVSPVVSHAHARTALLGRLYYTVTEEIVVRD